MLAALALDLTKRRKRQRYPQPGALERRQGKEAREYQKEQEQQKASRLRTRSYPSRQLLA